MPDTVPTTFLFALGEQVHWSAGGQAWEFGWQVLQRRVTQSMISTWAEYLLIGVTDSKHAPVWAYEPDLAPWHAGRP